MKNKALTYILGIAVLGVWGMIIYRVYTSVKGDKDEDQPIAKTMIKEPYDDYAIPKDTTHLLLNYRDPFGLVMPKDTIKVKVATRRIAAVLTPVNWNFIKYSGYIKNPGSRKLIALLTINGKEVMMTEGETIDNVRLLKNMRDSVRINFNGHLKSISMH